MERMGERETRVTRGRGGRLKVKLHEDPREDRVTHTKIAIETRNDMRERERLKKAHTHQEGFGCRGSVLMR